METMLDVMTRLQKKGYGASCRAAASGGLEVIASDRIMKPEEIVVDETIRIEGTSSPDEEAMIFALRSRDGAVQATFCVAHGAGMTPEEGKLVRQLQIAGSQ